MINKAKAVRDVRVLLGVSLIEAKHIVEAHVLGDLGRNPNRYGIYNYKVLRDVMKVIEDQNKQSTVAPKKTWVIIRAQEGSSIPSSYRPTVIQATKEAAEKEALRLAGNNPGARYVIYESVGDAVLEAPATLTKY